MAHVEFPKMMYHKKHGAKVVHTQKDADELESDWKASPNDVQDPEVSLKPGTDPTPHHETTATIPVVTTNDQTVGMATVLSQTTPDASDNEDGPLGSKALRHDDDDDDDDSETEPSSKGRKKKK